jgi:hypothetical protein
MLSPTYLEEALLQIAAMKKSYQVIEISEIP